MTPAEWEALCDGCGLCCLNKLEDWDSGEVFFTSVACRLLDGESCRCKDYENRKATVPDCIQLTVEGINEISWLPPTCAYRLVADGRDLYGGTTSYQATAKPCTRRAYPPAAARSAKKRSRWKTSKTISATGR